MTANSEEQVKNNRVEHHCLSSCFAAAYKTAALLLSLALLSLPAAGQEMLDSGTAAGGGMMLGGEGNSTVNSIVDPCSTAIDKDACRKKIVATQVKQIQSVPETNRPLGAQSARAPAKTEVPEPAAATEINQFQEFIASSIGKKLPLYGYDLFRGSPDTFAPLDNIPVIQEYVIGPGDELVIKAWGGIDIDYRAVVNRNGEINLPKIGSVNVAGIRYQDLKSHLTRAVGRVFRNFTLDVTLGKLRSVDVFVVGQAKRPGVYTVSSLSTLVNALFASGGPSLNGTMRQIQVKRANKVITTFDLYDLISKGDKSKDVKLLPGDVIYIPPVGQQVAITGSVNVPAIYEMKEGSTFADLLDLAGGLTNIASTQKASVEQILDRKLRKVDEFRFDAAGLTHTLHNGDVITVFPISQRFDNAVKLQGNVAIPIRHVWQKGMRVSDLLGGRDALIPSAYWARQNSGAVNSSYNKKEVNWDYAVIQRLDEATLTTRLFAFNLGKAIQGDPVENEVLQPGDIVTIYAADEELPKTENDIALSGSIFAPNKKRFVWREGMRISSLIPDAKWLIDYYGYWQRIVAPAKSRSQEYAGALTSNSSQNKNSQDGNLQDGNYQNRDSQDRNSQDRNFQDRNFQDRPTAAMPAIASQDVTAEINWDYANLIRLEPSDLSRKMITFDLGKAVLEKDGNNNLALLPGDEISIFTKTEIQVPIDKRRHYVRLEGEFQHAGIYQALPGETLRQLVARIGGLTPSAYLYGSEFTRVSVREMQQQKLREMADKMEDAVNRNLSSKQGNAINKEDADTSKVQAAAQTELIERMRKVQAKGRIVLEIAPDNTQVKDLPDLALDDGDRFVVPARPSIVQVLGLVYNENAFLYRPSNNVNGYLALAGGPTRDADEARIYLLRADGSVLSAQNSSSIFNSFYRTKLMPGDAVVVPEMLDKYNFTKELKDWSQIFYQFALGVAGLKVLGF
ncbi:MAG: SLBB domain-containing protein [Pseudomonadota bacterium]